MPTISPGPDSLYAEEVEYINRMLTAIDLAVEDTVGDTEREITRLEQEKLCYFLIQKFDIDVTYSWYLAGANTKVMGEPDRSQPRVRTTDTGLRQDTGYHPDIQKYRSYLRSESLLNDMSLEKIWFTDRYDFLEAFYEEHAPDPYLPLYLTSTRIREKLKRISDTISESSANTTLAEFTDSDPEPLVSEQEEEKFRLLISDFHLELGQIDDLAEIVPAVTMGTDVLEQVLAQLTTIDSLRPDQHDLINEVFRYFFYHVWRYPALYISTQTAAGPNKHHLVEEHADRFMSFHEELRVEAKQLRNRCEANGLYPDLNHHSTRLDEDKMRHLHEVNHDIVTAPRNHE